MSVNFSFGCSSLNGFVTSCVICCLLAVSLALPANAVDWLGGAGNWSDDLFWSTGFVPDPNADVWVNASGGSTITFDVASAEVTEFRLGNGEDNQDFNMSSGTLTITAANAGGTPSWFGRWSANSTTALSGTAIVDVTNVDQEATPFFIAGDQGPGGAQNNTQDIQVIVEDDAQLIVRDGGAPLDAAGNPTAGNLQVANWREAVATVTVRDNALIDVARDFRSNSGEWNLNQEGGTINVGNDFYIDRFDAIDGQGQPAEGTGLMTGGNMNVTGNFHVVQNGKGTFTVTDQGVLDIDDLLKVNDVWPAAPGPDGDGTLNITENGLVTTNTIQVPTSAQLINDAALLNISGGMLVIEDSAIEASADPNGQTVNNPIPDDVAGWIASGFLTGSLGTVNRTPSVSIPSISTMGDIAWGRASVVDGGALYIWTETIVAIDNADFDGSGLVDGNDFLIWQSGFGTVGTATAADGDANGDMNVDAADLAIWEAQYGTSPIVTNGAVVPEPSTLALLFGLALGANVRRSMLRRR